MFLCVIGAVDVALVLCDIGAVDVAMFLCVIGAVDVALFLCVSGAVNVAMFLCVIVDVAMFLWVIGAVDVAMFLWVIGAVGFALFQLVRALQTDFEFEVRQVDFVRWVDTIHSEASCCSKPQRCLRSQLASGKAHRYLCVEHCCPGVTQCAWQHVNNWELTCV